MWFNKQVMIVKLFIALEIFLFASVNKLALAQLNEFDISNSAVNTNDFVGGGPAKDGIPSIDKAVFISAKDADFLKENDLVVGILVEEEAKAYPLKILNWHEVVNDTIAQTPAAVTWCPLTKSAIVFKRTVDNELLNFGVSGLLYNGNLVFYDHLSNSLWPQLALGAVTGRFSSRKLSVIPSRITTWAQWKKEYPQTLLLSKNTGVLRDYSRDPYTAYHQSRRVMFPPNYTDTRLTAKTLVIGMKADGRPKAYPIFLIKNKGIVEDNIGSQRLKIITGPNNTAYAVDEKGELLPAVTMYWFAWSSFNRDTLVYGQ